MNIRYQSMVLALALLLLANCASATHCVVFVVDENHQTINNAKIYIDGWTNKIGTTTYNTGIGRNCWVGDIGQGEHTLNAEWNSMKPVKSTHAGSAAVGINGSVPMMITIVTYKVR
jgi:hypothetical protein